MKSSVFSDSWAVANRVLLKVLIPRRSGAQTLEQPPQLIEDSQNYLLCLFEPNQYRCAESIDESPFPEAGGPRGQTVKLGAADREVDETGAE
jgi:hypothetical protein